MLHKVVSDIGAERRLAIAPEVAGWSHLTFRTYGFAAGRPIDGHSVDDEVCMMFLAGTATVTVGGQTWTIDRASDVFDGPPQCVYLPPRHDYLLTPLTHCEVAYARWPAQGLLTPRFIAPETMAVQERGSGATAHHVTHILQAGEAEHLVCAETIVPPGHWCASLPLAANPAAGAGHLVAEAVCYYRLSPRAGWALQRLYSDDDDLDDTLLIGHGDGVMIRDSHHPVVAAPDAHLYILHVGAVVGQATEAAPVR